MTKWPPEGQRRGGQRDARGCALQVHNRFLGEETVVADGERPLMTPATVGEKVTSTMHVELVSVLGQSSISLKPALTAMLAMSAGPLAVSVTDTGSLVVLIGCSGNITLASEELSIASALTLRMSQLLKSAT